MIGDDILCVHYFESSFIEVEDVKEGIEIGTKMSPSDSTKLLVWVEHYVDITKEAREYLQENMRPLKVEANVLSNLAQKILYNLFLKLRKTKHPIRAFTKFDEAVKWLSSFE